MERTEDDELDPRIQNELEKLNGTAAQINELETHLDEIRRNCNKLLADGTKQIEEMRAKIGENALKNGKPYMMAFQLRKQAQQDTQDAAVRYERAHSMLTLAKEMEQNTEQKARQSEGPLDSALQEMLNHATIKVNEAKLELLESQKAHVRATEAYQRLDAEVRQLEKDHKSDIQKCKPFFQKVQRFNELMAEEKERVRLQEDKVSICKSFYADTLRALEQISLEIHEKRDGARVRHEMGQRGEGVGQESATWEEIDTSSLDSISLKSTSTDVEDSKRPTQSIASNSVSSHQPSSSRPESSSRSRLSSSMRRLKLKTKVESNVIPLVDQLQKTVQEHARQMEQYKTQQMSRTVLLPSPSPDSCSLASSISESEIPTLTSVPSHTPQEIEIIDIDDDLPTPKPVVLPPSRSDS